MAAVDRIQGITTGVAIKAPVKVATTAAVTLYGEQTINGVALVAGDRVLVKDQASAIENGIYDVSVTAWARSVDFDGQRDIVQGTLITVASATKISREYKLTTANPIIIGTSSISFVETEASAISRSGGGLDGRTILEAGSVTDATKEFLSGATFPLVPTNDRHYNLQVGDSSTLLTADMIINLVPSSSDWPEVARVIITKGDPSSYSVTVYGLNVSGTGTEVLKNQYDGVILGYHHTDGEDGPGALNQKWKVVGRFTKAQPIISKTAAEWTADAVTILDSAQIGVESDTGNFKFGNSSDLWSGLDYAIGGDSSTPVTFARTQPDPETGDFQLGDGHTTKYFNEGTQTLIDDRFVVVDPAAATEIELNSAHDIGTKYETHTADEDYTVTLVRETIPIAIVGDTTNSSDIITNIVDKSAIKNGDLYVGASFPGSTTVLDKDYASGQIQMSNQATVTAAGVDIDLTGKRGTINGVEGDLVFRKGIQMIEVVGTTTGVDAVVRGDIAGGGGPFDPVTITSTGNTNMAGTHFGKSVRVLSASGDPTYTLLSEAEYGSVIPDGTFIKFYWNGASDSFTFVEGTDVTADPADGQTRAMISGGNAMAEYLSSNGWTLSGGLALA